VKPSLLLIGNGPTHYTGNLATPPAPSYSASSKYGYASSVAREVSAVSGDSEDDAPDDSEDERPCWSEYEAPLDWNEDDDSNLLCGGCAGLARIAQGWFGGKGRVRL